MLGGASSGKSAWAEELVAGFVQVCYVATAPPRPGDVSWAARVQVHRARRPDHWQTRETQDLVGVLDDPPAGRPAILIDDLGGWLTARLDTHAAWDDPAGRGRTRADADRLVDAWQRCTAPVALVSPEVGLGVVPASPAGGLFRDELGRLNQRLAAHAERVVLIVAGCSLELATPRRGPS